MDERQRKTKKKHEQLIGNRFGRLVVKRIESGFTKGGSPVWYMYCDCDCGIKDHRVAHHNRKTVRSCGCYRSDSFSKRIGERGIQPGDRSERLVVLELVYGRTKTTNKSVRMVLCLCDCGNQTRIKEDCFKDGTTKSCGCLRRELALTRTKTHGRYRDPLYRLWQAVKDRTNNINHPHYGGRGIKMYQSWQDDFLSFAKYVETELGPKPTPQHSFDRIKVNGNYEPGNVRWASPKLQARNRRSNRYIVVRGETLLLQEWAEKLGTSPQTILQRFSLGWSEEKSVTFPVQRKRKSKPERLKRKPKRTSR